MTAAAAEPLSDEFDLIQKCMCGHPKAAHAMAYASSYAHPKWAPATCALNVGSSGFLDDGFMGSSVCGCESFMLDSSVPLPQPEPSLLGGKHPAIRHPHYERYGQPDIGVRDDGTATRFRAACRCGWRSTAFDVEGYARDAADAHEEQMNRMDRLPMEQPRDRHFVPEDVGLLCGCGHTKGEHFMLYGSTHAEPVWAGNACWSQDGDVVVGDNQEFCTCDGFRGIGRVS